MNKLIVILSLVLFGCASNQPTRKVLNCQSESIIDSKTVFIGGSKSRDRLECKTVQVPVAPKAQPFEIDPRLIDKNQI